MDRLLPLLAMLGAAGVFYLMDQTPAPQGKAAFVAELSGIVKSLTNAMGWPIIVVPVIVAWAAMESKWGTSGLAVRGNNLFGIKAGPTWQKEGKPFDEYDTHEHQGQPGYPAEGILVKAYFRHYGSWTASVQDVIKLLKIETVYKPAYDALARGDVQGFYQAIDASGYSTAAKYSNRIVGALNTVRGIA